MYSQKYLFLHDSVNYDMLGVPHASTIPMPLVQRLAFKPLIFHSVITQGIHGGDDTQMPDGFNSQDQFNIMIQKIRALQF
jgi:hypothetical protein